MATTLVPLSEQTVELIVALKHGAKETFDAVVQRELSQKGKGKHQSASLKRRAQNGHRFHFLGRQYEVATLPDMLEIVDLTLDDLDSTYLPRLSKEQAATRRYVARNPEALHPASPHLAPQSREIKPGWFISTNIGAVDLERGLRTRCRVSGLTYGVDIAFTKRRAFDLQGSAELFD